jgi:hypothetical protein
MNEEKMPLKTKRPIKLIGTVNWFWETGETPLGVVVPVVSYECVAED